jgi:hypothetical protein
MFKIVHPSGGYTSVSNNFNRLTMATLRNDSLQNLTVNYFEVALPCRIPSIKCVIIHNGEMHFMLECPLYCKDRKLFF